VIFLERLEASRQGIAGVLIHPDKGIICYTLERPWVDNQKFVSCIPAGTYPLVRYFSGRFNYHTYGIRQVEDRRGICFHIGNSIKDSQGCVLLGLDVNWTSHARRLVKSRMAMRRFMRIMNKKTKDQIYISNERMLRF